MPRGAGGLHVDEALVAAPAELQSEIPLIQDERPVDEKICQVQQLLQGGILLLALENCS